MSTAGGQDTVRVLSSTQLAILGAEVWSPDPGAFTVVSAVRVKGVPDWWGLADAVAATLSRHDVFTWRMNLDDSYNMVASGGPRPNGDHFAVEHVDLTSMSPGDAEAVVHLRLEQERRRVITLLDPDDRPYTRVVLFRFGGDCRSGFNGICALVTHHAFIDEHSTDLVWNEVFRRAAGRDVSDSYDRRYADWAAASVSNEAKAEAVRAADEVVRRLRSEPLGSIGDEQRSESVDVPGSPLWFAIPEELGNAAMSRARDLNVSVSAVYAGAWLHVLGARATQPRLAVTTPISLRRDLTDTDVIGCFIGAVPVLGDSVMGEEPGTAIRRWQRSLCIGKEHSHADVEVVQRCLEGVQRFSLTFETRSGLRTVKPIIWKVMPPPDSRAKSSLSLFLSLKSKSRWGAGDGRLLWRAGVQTEQSAQDLVADFVDALTLFAAHHPGSVQADE